MTLELFPADPEPDPYPTSRADDEVRLARAYLTRVAEPPAGPLVAFIAEVGPIEAARRIRAGEGLTDEVDSATRARRHADHAEADLEIAAVRGGRLVVPEDPEWPHAALRAFDGPGARASSLDLAPPLGLWVRGTETLSEAGHRSVAVVGSRAATDYGHYVAGDWSARLADAGVTVVSGAALGVDGAAHRGALGAGGVTTAVLACGIDRPYPVAHTRLLDHVAAHGLVVSEYPPGTIPARHRFLVRNRLVAAFAAGTLVVEAGARSGARRTALCAGALGRTVMVVPGPVTSALSIGCHAMARDPDVLVVGRVADVVEAVGDIGELAPDEPRPLRATDGLALDALRVHEAMPLHAARSPGRLAYEAGVDPRGVGAALSVLEQAGLVERTGEGWCRRPG